MDADDTENVHLINETVEDEILKDTKKFLDIQCVYEEEISYIRCNGHTSMVKGYQSEDIKCKV